MDDFRDEAEDHWEYNRKLIHQMVELVELLYIEAMAHGYKHGKDDTIANYEIRRM